MHIISFATAESDWKSPRMGIILHTNGRDSRERLDCEKLFAPAERPANPLDWFDMNGRWFQRARDTAVRLERDASALDDAREKGWLVPSGDAYWFAPVPRPGKIVCIGLNGYTAFNDVTARDFQFGDGHGNAASRATRSRRWARRSSRWMRSPTRTPCA